MNKNLLIFMILIAGLALPGCGQAAGSNELFTQSPEALVLRMEDLPAGTKYTIPEGVGVPSSGVYPNGDFLMQLGSDKGQELLKTTGRVTGWRVFYTRYNADDPGISQVSCTTNLFQSAAGARKFVTDYNPAALKMQNWELLSQPPQLGDKSVALLMRSQNMGLTADVMYRVQFAYRNAAVTVTAYDHEGLVKLEDATRLANLVLERLKTARTGTVQDLRDFQASLPTETAKVMPTPAPSETSLPTRTPGAYQPPAFAAVAEAKISRRPGISGRECNIGAEVPKYEPNSGKMWQVDLRSCDLADQDLSGRLADLQYADFNSQTRWPTAEKLPAGFDPAWIMELGKDPGLGLRKLHAQGITGQGVGIAIIDQAMLVDHDEYVGRLKLYEEVGTGRVDTVPAQMHGPAVASLAVGKTVGAAPGADLYYIASDCFFGGEVDFACLAKPLRRVIAINQGLPAGQKIRVVSMSIGWMQTSKGYAEISKAVQEAKAAGIFVLSTSAEQVYRFSYLGLGRDPLADPDQFGLYTPGMFWASSYYQNSEGYQGMVFVPMDSRTTASPTSPHDYVFYREGGLSWSVPYLAGVYALAAQVKPEITPEEFWSLALKTGRKVQVSHEGRRYTLDAVLDPEGLIKAVKE